MHVVIAVIEPGEAFYPRPPHQAIGSLRLFDEIVQIFRPALGVQVPVCHEWGVPDADMPGEWE